MKLSILLIPCGEGDIVALGDALEKRCFTIPELQGTYCRNFTLDGAGAPIEWGGETRFAITSETALSALCRVIVDVLRNTSMAFQVESSLGTEAIRIDSALSVAKVAERISELDETTWGKRFWSYLLND